MSELASRQRVGCYVDGFNLYFGLRDSGYRRFMWLDVSKLARHIVLPSQVVAYTKYFTARISGAKPTDRPDYAAERNAKRKRQATYLDALKALGEDLQIIEGHFLNRDQRCFKCGATWADAEEKMTDVNIATSMLVDAFANRFDTAVLISGDSDLVPPVKAVLNCFPHKRVIVAFPPGRSSAHLKVACSGQFVIHKGTLRKSQLQQEVSVAPGVTLRRPDKWS